MTLTAVGGAQAAAPLEAGNGLIFDPNTFEATAPETNQTTVTVFLNEHPFELGPGESMNGYEMTVVPAETSWAFALFPSQPYPSDPTTLVRFTLDVEGSATLRVFDSAGRVVRTLVSGELPAGRHEVVWDGRDDQEHPPESSVYFPRLGSGERTITRKLVRIN